MGKYLVFNFKTNNFVRCCFFRCALTISLEDIFALRKPKIRRFKFKFKFRAKQLMRFTLLDQTGPETVCECLRFSCNWIPMHVFTRNAEKKTARYCYDTIVFECACVGFVSNGMPVFDCYFKHHSVSEHSMWREQKASKLCDMLSMCLLCVCWCLCVRFFFVPRNSRLTVNPRPFEIQYQFIEFYRVKRTYSTIIACSHTLTLEYTKTHTQRTKCNFGVETIMNSIILNIFQFAAKCWLSSENRSHWNKKDWTWNEKHNSHNFFGTLSQKWD